MLFHAKTKYSTRLKALFELLFNNITTVCFTIDKNGIHLKTQTNQNILLEVNLLADKFDEYKFNAHESIHIGLESYINQAFKTVKNKSIVEFYITNPDTFDIKITSTADNCVFELSTVTVNVQNVSINPYEDYETPGIIVPTSKFSAMCRLVKETPSFTTIKKNGILEFKGGVSLIYTRKFLFGVEDLTDNSLVYHSFKSDQLTRIVKIVSFSSDVDKNLMIFIEENKPMLISCSSELGSLKAYIIPNKES